MAVMPAAPRETLQRTPLHALHGALGAKMVEFAGFEMPVSYPTGILKEHLHTRQSCGLFDVSHMGQAILIGADHEATATALERLTPGAFRSLGLGRMRYTLLLNAKGGTVDDLMVTRPASPDDDGKLMLVVNASRKQEALRYLAENLSAGVEVIPVPDRALLALQGPKAADALVGHCPEAADLSFMAASCASFNGIACHVGRAGYTGEDGFEISCRSEDAVTIARALLDEPEVLPVGLGARDSLRLEAGLCLYGHELDETTSPIEAGLSWALPRQRRREGGFPGEERILRELIEGPSRVRVGIRPVGRVPAREGVEIRDANDNNIGRVTSGGFGPSLDAPLAMGYVAPRAAAPGGEVMLVIRGKSHPAMVTELPFIPHRYRRSNTG